MSPGDLALFFLPESAYPFVIAVLALGIVVGFLPLGKGARLILLIALMPLMSSVTSRVLEVLPWYVAVGLLLFVGLSVVRGVLELFLGREAAGHVLAWCIIGLAKLTFRVVAVLVAGGFTLLRLALRASARVEPRRLQ